MRPHAFSIEPVQFVVLERLDAEDGVVGHVGAVDLLLGHRLQQRLGPLLAGGERVHHIGRGGPSGNPSTPASSSAAMFGSSKPASARAASARTASDGSRADHVRAAAATASGGLIDAELPDGLGAGVGGRLGVRGDGEGPLDARPGRGS